MKILFIGIGNMGLLMLKRLLDRGYTVYTIDIDESRLAVAAKNGAVTVTDQEAYHLVDYVIFMVPHVHDMNDYLFGPHSIIPKLNPAATAIYMGTGSPTEVKETARRLEKLNADFLDAPVSGGIAKAESGELSIIVGGEKSVYNRAIPLFQVLGNRIFHVGPPGTAQTIKLINNLLTGVNLAAACEAMLLGSRAGVDPETLLKIINCSSGQSYSSHVKLNDFVLKKNFQPGFKLELQHRDLHLANELAKELGTPSRLGELAENYYKSAIDAGFGDLDSSSVILLLESMEADDQEKDEV